MSSGGYTPRTPRQVYYNLIIGILIILFPAVIVALSGEDGLKGSMSSYYHTDSRWWFVVGMFSIGFFLILYRGYKPSNPDQRNWDATLSTLAGLFAILTAIFPTADEGLDNDLPNILHPIFAGALYFFIGVILFKIFVRGDEKVGRKKLRNWIYKLCAILIWLSIIGIGLNDIFELEIAKNWTFILEYVANTAFAFGWMTKAGGTFWVNDNRWSDWRPGEKIGVVAFIAYVAVTIFMVYRITSVVF